MGLGGIFRRLYEGRLVEAGKSGNLEYIMWMRVKAAEMDQIVMSVFDFVKEVATYGHRHVLEWLQTEYGTNFETSIPAYIAQNVPDICLYASRKGHLNILQWAFSNGLHIDFDTCLNGCPWSDRTYKALKSHEYEDRSEWAFKNGCRDTVPVTHAQNLIPRDKNSCGHPGAGGRCGAGV